MSSSNPVPAAAQTPSGQVRLEFDTQEQAVEYAQREGMTFRVEEARERKRLVKTYSENFAFDRKQPWTH